MSISPTDIASLVETVVTPLVEYPDDLEITSQVEEDNVLVEIKTHEDDAGKVIGRQGRVIKAVRTVARAAGSRIGVSVDVELLD